VLAFLQRTVRSERLAELTADLVIDLSPPPSAGRNESAFDDTELAARELTHTVQEGSLFEPTAAADRPNLGRLQDLLDRFAILQPGRTGHSHQPGTINTSRLRLLLEAFTAERGRLRQATPHGQRTARAATREALCVQLDDLLDRFVALRPMHMEAAGAVVRYQELLDRYAALRR
jgi:hypothetical protein